MELKSTTSAAQREAISYLEDAVNALVEGFILWDSDLKFVFCNERYKELALPPGHPGPRPGQGAEEFGHEIFETGFWQLPPGLDRFSFSAQIIELIKSYVQGLEISRSDGCVISASSNETALGGYVLTFVDITDRKRAEVAEARETEIIKDVVDSISEGFALWSTDMKFMLANDKYLDMLFPPGHPAIEPGEDAWDVTKRLVSAGHVVLPAQTDSDQLTRDVLYWTTGLGEQREFRLTDGRTVLVRSSPTPLGGCLTTVLDITEEVNAEQKARDMLFSAFQTLDDGMVLLDEKMQFLFGNDAWHGMMFDRPDRLPPTPGTSILENCVDLAKTGFYDVPGNMTEEDYVAWMLGEMIQHGKKIPYRSADGRHFVGSSHRTPRGGYLLSFQDTTKLRQAEDRLLQSVTSALQSLTDGIALFDENLEYIFGNKRYLGMFYPGDIKEPHTGERIEDIARRVVSAGHMKLPDDLELEQMCEYLVQQARQFAKNIPLETEDRSYVASAHQTDLGGYLLEFTDVTDRLRAEEELSRQKEISHQNEKLSALGELLAGVAHELNNPLSVVFGYAQMLEGKVDDPKIAERLGLIRQSAERAAKIVKTFLAMARQRPMKVEICSINEIVETAIEVSSYGLTANGTRVVIDLDRSIPAVLGDFDQLAQVFANLIANAGHALQDQREAGKLTLKSSYDGANGLVIIKVKDNGPGIPADLHSRVFEPFFTTKEVGEGTGVGLAFSHRIVKSHGGELSLRSDSGRGARFYIKLKAVEASSTGATIPDTLPQNFGRHSVLVVDDEVGVARLTHDLLVEAGFVVTQCTNPRDALAILEGHSFDAVLSDFKMPDMDGEEFFNAIKVVAPECVDRIGFITGDAMSRNVTRFFEKSRRPYIEKPIMKDELLALAVQLCRGDAQRH